MEVHITSKGMVQPSSQEVCLRKPFKLSFLDQITPAHYVPTIFFYDKPSDSHFDKTQVLDRLKISLSNALNQFYPLSGRTIDNLYIGSYDKGVPYVEARVSGCLSNYLRQTEPERLNQLLPCPCFCSIPISTSPQVAIQVNVFDCGGMAIALCCSHKIMDAITVSAFLKSWAAFSRGSNGEITNNLDLLEAASRIFPPLESIPPTYLSLTESFWFEEGWHKTRKFVFDANAIATLMYKAKSKRLEHPTRIVALTAFVWKYAMLASRSASGISKPSLLAQAVNIRPRMKPRLPGHSIGNLIPIAIATYNSVEKNIELNHLAYLVREAVESFVSQLGLFQGEEEYLEFMSGQLNEVAEFASQGDIDFYGFSSLLNTLDGNEIDFGWGEPSLLSLAGVERRYHAYSNPIVLKEIGQHKAIEAWITLDEKVMDILEQDPDFLAFVSPNPC